MPRRRSLSNAAKTIPSLPLDAHLPSAVVGAILMKYLDPETGRASESPPRAGRRPPSPRCCTLAGPLPELQKLVHAPAPPPASLTETLALLQHCSLADDSKSVGVGVIPLLRVDAASCARNAELRCPLAAARRPWMPSACASRRRRLDAARGESARVAPIPPVCELVARDPGSVGALRAFAEALDQKGECGVVAAATCDLLLVPRKAVLKWLYAHCPPSRRATRRTSTCRRRRRGARLGSRRAAQSKDDAAILGRRRAAEDHARRRARGADRPAPAPRAELRGPSGDDAPLHLPRTLGCCATPLARSATRLSLSAVGSSRSAPSRRRRAGSLALIDLAHEVLDFGRDLPTGAADEGADFALIEQIEQPPYVDLARPVPSVHAPKSRHVPYGDARGQRRLLAPRYHESAILQTLLLFSSRALGRSFILTWDGPF